ncbi:unnamed protein product [Prunus armeniaca]|uniref:Uncharacterized protein n=1 Tax=Prunus armeniaca TaxID=36596 RepID=A0A6J5TMJ7_PRUAR|nr:unnamed protein product [Prunus armeniaca]CAB4295030.1 unnamed protein product [Prunus armeniaca]
MDKIEQTRIYPTFLHLQFSSSPPLRPEYGRPDTWNHSSDDHYDDLTRVGPTLTTIRAVHISQPLLGTDNEHARDTRVSRDL